MFQKRADSGRLPSGTTAGTLRGKGVQGHWTAPDELWLRGPVQEGSGRCQRHGGSLRGTHFQWTQCKYQQISLNKPGTAKVGAISKAHNCKRGTLWAL